MVASVSGTAATAAGGRTGRVALAAVAAAIALLAWAAPAFGAQASSGELVFYPCSDCHPVTVSEDGVPSHPLPNDFKGHGITLEGHSALGKDEKSACVACHLDGSRDPSKFIAADGTYIDIKGDISKLCFKCHYQKYNDWKAGIHGKRAKSCVVAGCHDPHTPGVMYAGPLPPFTSAGFQFRVLPEREPFTPLAPPPAPSPVLTPVWFVYMAIAGVALAAGLLGLLVSGKVKR